MVPASLKILFKYLIKNKLYTFITISGFAVSLMFVLLLVVYTRQELEVDQFHANKDRIFRLTRDNGASFAPPVGSLIKNQYPEVESYSRIYMNSSNAIFSKNEQKRFNYILADSSFFNIFSFRLIKGDPDQALAAKNSAVLSLSFARKIFGEEDPTGKTFTINKLIFVITGISEDMPPDTHFQKCDAFLNFNVLADLWGYKELLTTNDNSSFGIYFLAKKGTDLPSKAPYILEQFKKDYWLYSNGFSRTLRFEPLTEVYFSKESSPAIRQNSRTSVFIFGGIALLILIIAIINYINLTLAQAGFRSKESSIRKLMGSSEMALIWQHIFESVALSALAALIAIELAFLVEPFFNTQMDCQLNLNRQFTFPFVIIVLAIVFSTGFISGIIPAIVINRFNPIDVVKGNITLKIKGRYSKILISFQYCVAIILLICTWTISRQSTFMRNFNIGFEKENLFWMENSVSANQRMAFSHLLKSIPGVAEVSYCSGTPLDGGNNQSFKYKGKAVSFQEFVVDSVFFKMMGMKVTSTDAAFAKNGVWLNRTALSELDLGENPVSFQYYNADVPVLGIIDDFNFRSLHSKIGPLIVRQLNPQDAPWSIMVRLTGNDPAATVSRIRKEQSEFTGGIPMDSGFMDDSINKQYIKEVKRSKLIGSFTFLSIIISSMGIFAMALYYIQQKVKEIGIRKINGSTIMEIMVMLNRDFLQWVTIAFIIACPIAWFSMHKWLENFAYKTVLSWWIFVFAGLLAFVIALLTVSWQSWRAATRNPVEALRYE